MTLTAIKKIKDMEMINKKLTEIYQSLPEVIYPKKQMKEKIAEKCNASEGTVRNWVEGKTAPKEVKNVFAIVEALKELKFNVNPEKLF